MALIDVRFVPNSNYPLDVRSPDGQLGLTIEEGRILLNDVAFAIAEAERAEAERTVAKPKTIFLRKVA